MNRARAAWPVRLKGRSSKADEWQAQVRSGHVVEDVPADGGPALLMVENEFADSGRKVRPLPLPFLGPGSGSVAGWYACASRPDGVQLVVW
jgi:hypothetical protein